MRKLFEKIWKKEEGFTLIELIIVIAILAIISAIAIPNILSAVDNSRRTTDVSNARLIADAVALAEAQSEIVFSPSTTIQINSTNVSASSNQSLFNALNGNLPTPAYHGTDGTTNLSGVDIFIISFDASGNISVYAGIAAATPTLTAEVFPNTNNVYNNQ